MLEDTKQMDQAILNSDPIVTCEPEASEPPVDYESLKKSPLLIPWTPTREKLIRVTTTPTLIYLPL